MCVYIATISTATLLRQQYSMSRLRRHIDGTSRGVFGGGCVGRFAAPWASVGVRLRIRE